VFLVEYYDIVDVFEKIGTAESMKAMLKERE
jgi:hypothetical protein